MVVVPVSRVGRVVSFFSPSDDATHECVLLSVPLLSFSPLVLFPLIRSLSVCLCVRLFTRQWPHLTHHLGLMFSPSVR